MSLLGYDLLFDFDNPDDLNKAIKIIVELDRVYDNLIKTATQGSKQLQASQSDLKKSAQDLLNSVTSLKSANEDDSKQIVYKNTQAKALNETYKAQKNEIESLNAQINKLTTERKKVAKGATDLNGINKTAIKLEDQLGQATGRNAQENAELRLQIQQANKAAKEKAQQTLGLVSLYQKESKNLITLRNKYKDLALQFGENSRAAQLYGKRVELLDSKLKRIDANAGQYTRTVGNYATGWNGLGNSINQLTREAPAFANSMQTGFMALSNNIPILADEIGNLVKQNKVLIAQGKPTKSVFDQIASAVFSWQTLLSVGVTVLTVYGKELFELGRKALDLKSNFDALKTAQKASLDISGQSVSKFKALVSVVNDYNSTEEERKSAIDELNKTYPDFNANILTEFESTKELTSAVQKYVDTLRTRALAQAALEESTKKQKEALAELIKVEEIKSKIDAASERKTKILNGEIDKSNVKRREVSNLTKTISRLTSDLEKQQDSYSKKQKEVNDLIAIFQKNYDENTFGDVGNGAEKAANDLEKFLKQLKEIGARAAQELDLDLDTSFFDELDAEIKEQERASKEWADTIKNGIDQLMPSFDDFIKAEQEKTDAAIESNLKIAESDKQLSMQREQMIKNWKEASFAAFQFVSDVGNQFFENASIRRENDLENFRTAKEKELESAQNNEQKRAAIEAQIAAKEKEARRKSAQDQKKQAIFNIAIDTVASIVKTGANLGYPFAIPFQLAAAALGVTQAALVASEPLPAFEKGGIMPYTGKAKVSEAGREIIIDKRGNVTLTGDNGAEIRDIEGGSRILNNAITENILNRRNVTREVNETGSDNIQSLLEAERVQNAHMIATALEREHTYTQGAIKQAFKALPELHTWELNGRGDLTRTVQKGTNKTNNWRAKNSYNG